MQSLRSSFRASLLAFASSPASIQVLRTVPSSCTPPLPKILYVLDSSFNPPTLAHQRLASSALDSSDSTATSKRLLLLLATQNADKAPKPASFEHRLVMMTIFAEDLLHSLSSKTKEESNIAVDIGITKHPFFIDKCSAIASSGIYQAEPSTTHETPIEQVHLVGFDTLIRLLDSKYYPPSHTLAPLQSLFEHHRLRVTYRADDDWGGRSEQDTYLQDLRDGKREDEGGRREWAEKIQLVEGRRAGEKAISSTRIRNAVQGEDVKLIHELCTEGVADYVLDEKLYTSEGV
ncbi:hypothetical protein MMC13_001776 [Lambiella insularis]|nr:hypothetical protein [Lambiella insularis]